jgi:hypothetical protein
MSSISSTGSRRPPGPRRRTALPCRPDFLIPDELGDLPFARTGGQFRFHRVG